MSEENKIIELKDEELENVNGGMFFNGQALTRYPFIKILENNFGGKKDKKDNNMSLGRRPVEKIIEED